MAAFEVITEVMSNVAPGCIASWNWRSRSAFSPAKSLQIATFNAARLLKQEKELGSIAAGKGADFLLVQGNPAEYIGDIRRCRLVMKNGTLYSSGDLFTAVGVQPA